MSVKQACDLVVEARENLELLLAGELAAIYRNDPVFMLAVELVEKAVLVLEDGD